jgi:hypothetical protein
MWKRLAAAALLVCSASAAAEPFDPRPWLEDLEQMRQAFHEKYANLDWLESEREIKLDPLFDQASIRFRGDGSNEVRGILPDEVVALRADDGVQLRAKLVAEKLPSAVAQAKALHAQSR